MTRVQGSGDPEERLKPSDRSFPIAAGVLLGLGLGGFFDGIVLHQVLQWHHMISSAGYPPDTVENMRINVLADGLFHAATYGFVVAGILVLWRKARRPHFLWSQRMLAGSVLTGFGAFNVIEGAVNHDLLEIHHVNETVPRDQWIWWDVGFLAWGAIMLFVGVLLLRGRAEEPVVETPVPPKGLTTEPSIDKERTPVFPVAQGKPRSGTGPACFRYG